MNSVDVIVPCYRYGRFLRESVESVLQQEGVQVRVLIIDDASPDDTPVVGEALAREDARVTFRRHAHNAGHIATYNEGLEWASADCLLLLSADDYLLPGALKRAVKVLNDHPRMSFVFGEAVLWKHADPRPSVLQENLDNVRVSVMSGTGFIHKCRAYNLVATPTAVVRTSAQKKVGGYRENLTHTGDLEMWWRLAVHGDVGAIEAKQAVYRRHAGNMSQDYLGVFEIEQRELAVRSFLENGGVPANKFSKIEKTLYRGLARYTVAWAGGAFIMGDHDMQEKLVRHALSIDPGVKYSLSWVKLTCKKILGRPACLWVLSRFGRSPGPDEMVAARNAVARSQGR